MKDNQLDNILEILNKNKLSHAIMIESGEESERLNTAKKIAQALVCSKETRPCNFCSNCKKALSSSHPDIAVYEGGTSPGSFKVDFVREISKDAAVLPNEADRKVYILNRSDTMSVSAQNALLKILEEPPRYINFILLLPSVNAVLPTILSRVTVYSLTDPVNTSDEDILKASSVAKNILNAVINNNELEILKTTVDFEKDKNALKMCCSELINICSEALISKLTGRKSMAEEFSVSISSNKLTEIIENCKTIINAADANMNNNLLVTLFCSKMIS